MRVSLQNNDVLMLPSSSLDRNTSRNGFRLVIVHKHDIVDCFNSCPSSPVCNIHCIGTHMTVLCLHVRICLHVMVYVYDPLAMYVRSGQNVRKAKLTV